MNFTLQGREAVVGEAVAVELQRLQRRANPAAGAPHHGVRHLRGVLDPERVRHAARHTDAFVTMVGRASFAEEYLNRKPPPNSRDAATIASTTTAAAAAASGDTDKRTAKVRAAGGCCCGLRIPRKVAPV